MLDCRIAAVLFAAAVFYAGFQAPAQTSAGGSAQSSTSPEITFHFERPGMSVPEFTFVLREDGSGTYSATVMQLSESRYSEPSGQPVPTTAFSTPFKLPPQKSSKLFGAVRDAGYLQKDCASKAKNIADTGTKTLTYKGPTATGRCVYNYTTEKPVAALTTTFEGMSLTFESGRRLAHDERYDRLGLDHEMNALVEALKDGRAEAPELIAPELRALVADEQVMQRVRRNATILLDKGSLEQ